MSSHHTLTIEKDMKRVPFELRAKEVNRLKRLLAEHGLTHTRGSHERAAEMISAHPLVVRVVVTHVTETSAGVWRDGKRS